MTPTLGPVRVPSHWLRAQQRPPRTGRRSDAVAEMHLTCTAGDHEVEVFVRDLERGRRIDIVGQVTSIRDRHVPCAGVPLALVAARDGAIVATTSTSTYGEFVFDPNPAGTFGLRLGWGPQAPIVLLWEGDL